LTDLVLTDILTAMSGDFGGGSELGPVAHPEAELRAADAQRPQEYRNAVDRAGAGVDPRVVVAIVVIVALVVWLLTTLRP
jgi:hypothetical protein